MLGQTISHYKILEKLGEGGMGVVYKAQDLKLDRLVALKFLPHHLTIDDVQRARFVQEAKAASALDHPNVCGIHAIEEYEGQQFIDMEYVDGVTLRQKISFVGAIHDQPASGLAGLPLPMNDVLSYAIQIAEALHEAHSKGIIHRDIKSENIMVNSKDQIKVMDFGLAKLKGAQRITRSASTVGTLAYMAPELVQGGEADGRSDIFSFGVVLYEMLIGRLPFRGEHEAAIVYSILNEEPESVNELPQTIRPIVEHALAKDAGDRYQHVEEMLNDLKAVQRGTEIRASTKRFRRRKVRRVSLYAGIAALLVLAGYVFFSRLSVVNKIGSIPERKMLVVLPFENLGPPDAEYFADGITDEITTSLAKISGLGVISRTSAIKYKKSQKSLREIGNELGVEYVLEGTILSDKSSGANRVRINPQLIRVKDDTHLWAEAYDRVVEQTFTLQSEIATNVTSALNVALLEPERRTLTEKPTENVEAFQYFLRGNEYFNRGWADQDLRIAIEMYQKALQLDSNFAYAYAMVSTAHAVLYWFHDRAEGRLQRAKELVEKALQLKPDLPEAHLALGYYYYYGPRDYDHALEQFYIAQKNLPNNANLLWAIGVTLRNKVGGAEEGAKYLVRALELDPTSRGKALTTGGSFNQLRKYPEAERYYRRAIEVAPDWFMGYFHTAFVHLMWDGNTKKAREVLEAAREKVDPGPLFYMPFLCELYDGNYQKALDLFTGPGKFADMLGRKDTVAYYLFKAQLYGLLKQPLLQRGCYDSAQAIVEQKIRVSQEDFQFHMQLGLTSAGLGRKEEAIREGKRGVELLPVSKDAFWGPFVVEDMARIYTLVGEQDAAIDQLEYLLSIPAFISAPMIRLDPTWTPLRSNPRFQKLLAGK